MSPQRYMGMTHACVCMWGVEVGGGGGEGGVCGCLASVSGSVCVFVFVIRVTARSFLVSEDKNKVLSLES